MAPEIYINEKLVVNIPDQTGVYETPIGQIYVDSSRIHPERGVQQLVLRSEALKGQPGRSTENGERVIELSKEGTGSQILSKTEKLSLSLHEPIRRHSPNTGRLIKACYPDYPELNWGIR